MKSPLSLFLAEIYPTKLKNNQSTTICRIQNDILMILKDKDEKQPNSSKKYSLKQHSHD
ncbi:hypothetical protein Smp_168180 [Schistosoma mansoni]|uniref:hypothetical protein n=1 Tax=Schistosoma mansoni TaxID=6183 RepID=UPI0001A61B98|nr:hypothetical protein Smp_168180 [Schistosoma mansoni]|eukprot:XP_018651278.1 hypothetical protein Smp_168180 [Schistosoma mansoni]